MSKVITMPRSGKVLLDNARAVITGPLKFGNDAQIRAIRFLNDAQEQYEHLRSCGRCQNHIECGGMASDPDIEAAAWALAQGDSIE